MGGQSVSALVLSSHGRSDQVSERSVELLTVIAIIAVLASLLLAALLALPPGGLPCLLPAPIADCIAQHQHGIDVVPTEAACRLLLTVLRRRPYWHFPHCLSQWASRLPDRWDTAYAPRVSANKPVSP